MNLLDKLKLSYVQLLLINVHVSPEEIENFLQISFVAVSCLHFPFGKKITEDSYPKSMK